MASVPTSTGGFDLTQFLRGLGGAGMDIYSLIKNQGPKDASTAINIADPLLKVQGSAQDQMAAFLADPSSVLQDPAFKAAQAVGAEDISRQAGARGMAGSGNRLADLFSFGQASGLGFENQKYNQLLQLLQGSPQAANIYMGGQQSRGNSMADLLNQLLGGAGVSGVLGQLPQLLKMIGGSGLGGGGGYNNAGGDVNPGQAGPTDPGGQFDPTGGDWSTSPGWTSGSDLPTDTGTIDWGNIDWNSLDLGF